MCRRSPLPMGGWRCYVARHDHRRGAQPAHPTRPRHRLTGLPGGARRPACGVGEPGRGIPPRLPRRRQPRRRRLLRHLGLADHLAPPRRARPQRAHRPRPLLGRPRAPPHAGQPHGHRPRRGAVATARHRGGIVAARRPVRNVLVVELGHHQRWRRLLGALWRRVATDPLLVAGHRGAVLPRVAARRAGHRGGGQAVSSRYPGRRVDHGSGPRRRLGAVHGRAVRPGRSDRGVHEHLRPSPRPPHRRCGGCLHRRPAGPAARWRHRPPPGPRCRGVGPHPGGVLVRAIRLAVPMGIPPVRSRRCDRRGSGRRRGMGPSAGLATDALGGRSQLRHLSVALAGDRAARRSAHLARRCRPDPHSGRGLGGVGRPLVSAHRATHPHPPPACRATRQRGGSSRPGRHRRRYVRRRTCSPVE